MVDNDIWETLDGGTSENARRSLALIDRIPPRISPDCHDGVRDSIEEALAKSFVLVFVIEHRRKQFGLGFGKYQWPHEDFLSFNFVCSRAAASFQSEAVVRPAS